MCPCNGPDAAALGHRLRGPPGGLTHLLWGQQRTMPPPHTVPPPHFWGQLGNICACFQKLPPPAGQGGLGGVGGAAGPPGGLTNHSFAGGHLVEPHKVVPVTQKPNCDNENACKAT